MHTNKYIVVCRTCNHLYQTFLPTPTVKGEPVRGGVAGMFLGGSGGGAVKKDRCKYFN